MPRNRYITVVNRKNEKRRPYNLKRREETRGMIPGEPHIVKYFWRRHNMDDIIVLSPQELETLLDEFYKAYEKAQWKGDKGWWYPANPKYKSLDKRKD